MASETADSKGQETDISKDTPTAPSGSKFIELPESGFTLRYADTKDGDSPDGDSSSRVTFLLLHGFVGVLETWDFLTPHLLESVADARVVAPDLVGSGFSDKPDAKDFDYSYRSQGRIVTELISVLGLSRVVLVGHSAGSVVAAAAAVRASRGDGDVVAGAVFLANALFRPKTAVYTDRAKTPMIKSYLNNMLGDRRGSMEKMHLPDHAERVLTEDFVEKFAAPTRLPGFFDALVETVMVVETPYEELVDEILSLPPGNAVVPMLFVFGDSEVEPPTPELQKESIRKKLDAMDAERREQQPLEIFDLESCHHYPQHEQPEALAKEILRFVERNVFSS